MKRNLPQRAGLVPSADGKKIVRDLTGTHPNWCVWLPQPEAYLLAKVPSLEPLRAHVYTPKSPVRFTIHTLQREGYKIQVTFEKGQEMFRLIGEEPEPPPPPSRDFDVRVLFVDAAGTDEVDVEFGAHLHETMAEADRNTLEEDIRRHMMDWLFANTKEPERTA